ncbi:MAG: hypothetical protein AAFQ66_12920 [Pseudomonadota bacterium]
MTRTFAILMTFLVTATLALATPKEDQQSFDLLFRNGTLDAVDRQSTLVYQRAVTNRLKPDAGTRDTGEIALSIQSAGDSETAHLEFRQEGKHRPLGQFPASVGNPMIMVFYEATVRDMAEAAGGSPFYIRNRVKEALAQPSAIETGEADYRGKRIETQTVSLFPFADDPNRDRMQGFGDLELRVTMSDEVPGWYLTLSAEAGAVYSSEMTLGGLE